MHFRFPTSRYTSPIKQKYNHSHIICPCLSKDASKHEKNVNEMGSFFALLLRFFCVKRVETAAPPSSPRRSVSAARRKIRYVNHVVREAKIRHTRHALREAENTVRGPCPPQGGKYGTRAVSAARRKTRYVNRVTAKKLPHPRRMRQLLSKSPSTGSGQMIIIWPGSESGSVRVVVIRPRRLLLASPPCHSPVV